MPSLITDVMTAGRLAAQEQPTLRADGGLVLRPWKAADAPAVFRAFQDPVLRRWHTRSADSQRETEGWIEEWRAAWTAEHDAFWAVAEADTDTLAGRIALRHIQLSDGVAEVAYWTVASVRGRGVAPRAVAALADWALDAGFHRLELTHATGNEASCRVAVKTGFLQEGTKRSALLHADGWHDMHLHARIGADVV